MENLESTYELCHQSSDLNGEKTNQRGTKMWKMTKTIALPILVLTANLFIFWWLFSQWHISIWTLEGVIMIINCSLWTLLSIISVFYIERL